MQDIAKFIQGFMRFQQNYFCDEATLFAELLTGQNPKALVVACSDSRVDPAIITDCAPGDIFVIRNVANLVPAYEPDGRRHGVSAALEFAVRKLKVEHIIILGHSRCGGIEALLEGGEDGESRSDGDFILDWMNIAAPAREQVRRELPDMNPEKQCRACEQAAVLVSLRNLLTFPWVASEVEAGRLLLHGWYFDMEKGELLGYLPQVGSFEPLAPKCYLDSKSRKKGS